MTRWYDCPRCLGTKTIQIYAQEGQNYVPAEESPCPKCQSSGPLKTEIAKKALDQAVGTVENYFNTNRLRHNR